MRVSSAVTAIVCLSVLTPGVSNPGPALAQMLPPGAASEAPGQFSGAADDLRPGGSTETSLGSVQRRPVRPDGAVPERSSVPALDPRRLPTQQRLTDVKLLEPEKQQNATIGTELFEQRSATSSVYQNADGTRTRRLYSEPVHARRPDGTWAPIDLDLTTDTAGRIVPRLAPQQVTIAPTKAEATLAVDATHDITLGLREADVPGRVSGERVDYRGARLGATASGMEQELVLHSASAPTTYDLDLRLRGLTPALDRDTGGVTLSDEQGVARAVIAAASMRDAKGATSAGVRYDLRNGVLRVELDKDWLRDGDRAFPVLAAVSTRINSDGDDTYVTTGSPGNHSGEETLKVGNEGSGRVHSAYLHFSDFVSQLRNQYIVGATLNLYNVHSGTCVAKPVDVYAVGAAWSGSRMTTWPGAPLGRHLSQRSFSYGRAECPAAWASLPLELDRDVLTDWTHGTPFYGLSVRSANEGDTGGFKRFASREATAENSTGVPYLDVSYSAQGADFRVDEVTLPTANRAGQLKATVTNRGSATWTPGGPHKFGFIVKKGATVVQTSPKFSVPGNVAPNASVAMTVPIAALAPGEYMVSMTMYEGNTDYRSYGVPYGAFALRVVNVPPTTRFQQPASGASVDSIRPTLYAEGYDDDNWPGTGLKYKFKICSGTPEAPTGCTQTDDWTNATWVPPAGRLRWSQTYYWWVQVHDNVTAGEWRGPLQLNTRVPQPEITSHLGGTPQGAPAPGLDPQVGNYGMATTDASVATVGPDLTITRTYNSLDPRATNAFGEGWTSALDTELSEDDDGSGNVTVTLPSGRQVRFGRDHDGTYAPPMGHNLTLVYDTSSAKYTLRDTSGSQWRFYPCGKLDRITDPSGLVKEIEYTAACPGGTPTGVRNLTSGRRLNLTWTGGHVTQVSTDRPAPDTAAPTWTYTYDGDRLTSACAPAATPTCTRYAYQPGSHYRSVAVDDSPRAYWRLGETTTGAAANVTARTPGADAGAYQGVTLGVSGALAGTADTAAAFNGASSRVDLPAKMTGSTITLAVELWFKTTANGVLMSYADQPFGSATASKKWTPILYVGQDDYLRGGFWVPKPDGQRQIVSDAVVNDGRWHHAVLSGSIDVQKLYVDGVAQKDDADPAKDDTVSGLIDHDEMPYVVAGAGKTTGWPSGNGGDHFFAGAIDELAVYHHPLGSAAIAQHAAAARQVQQLTKVTLPQDDRVAAQLTYDTVADRVAAYTDHAGRKWTLDAPTRNEAVRRVALRGPYPDYTYEFDADQGGRQTKRTHDGRTRTYEYNTAGFRSAEVDELGHRVSFTTDDRGNTLSRTTCRAAGSCQTSYSTFFVDKSKPLDPRNDRMTTNSDARSSGPTDTTYRTTYQYDTVGRLKSITYPKPAGVTTDPVETWTYSVGDEAADGGGTVPAGLLLQHDGRRAGQTTRFLYRSNGDLAEQVSPLGLRTRSTYDAIGRRVGETRLRASGEEIGTTTTTYTPRSEVETVTSPPVTNAVSGVRHTLQTRHVYDANGNRTRTTQSDTTGGDPARTMSYTYDAHDMLIATTYPDGRQEKRELRSAGMEERVTDRAGTTWVTHYDTQGRALRRTAVGAGVDPADPGAEALVLEVRAYDAAGRLAGLADAMGRETRYTYYDDDLPATATRTNVLQADGTRRNVVLEQLQYDAAGNVTKSTASGGRIIATTYDAGGNLATETLDPAGLNRAITYTRAADGQPVAVKRTGAAQPSRSEITEYRYDAAGLLLAEDVRPDAGDPGSVLSTTYDRDERGLARETADRKRLPTSYTYDALDRPVTTTGPQVETWAAGQKRTGVKPQSTVGYNTFGEATHTKDPNGAVVTAGYDLLGQATSIRRPDYTPPGGQPIRAESQIGYDALGNATSVTDPLRRTTTRTFDPYGRLLTETPPAVDGQTAVTTVRYDREGEPRAVTDANGATVEYTYDELGRRLTQTAAERAPQAYYITRYGYDDAGNLTATTSPAGNTTTATYNAAGEQLTSVDPTGRTTRSAYDDAGRPREVTTPAGVTTRTEYNLIGQPLAIAQLTGNPPAERRRWKVSHDPNGNLTQGISPEGRTAKYGYDAMNRLVGQEEQAGDSRTISTAFGYDAAGNRTRYVDGNQHATDYTFTPWGLPESTIEPATTATPDAAGRTWTMSYDAAGNAVRQVAPGGVVLTADFDARDRLKAQHGTGAEAPTADKTYSYDRGGRLVAFGGPSGPTALTYDDRGNLLTTRGPAGDATFTYTADGRTSSRADATGTSAYAYDGAGRPLSVTDGLSGRTVLLAYDTGGRLAYSAERGLENLVKRVREYDTLGRLTGDVIREFDPGGAPRAVQGTEYGYDGDDNVTAKKTITGGVPSANTYRYDGAGRLVSWTPSSGAATAYEWDAAGNRTKAGSTAYTYDERNQLLLGGGTTYTYTQRGTMATAGTRRLAFDAFDQLASDGAQYTYDSLGRIAQRNGAAYAYSGLGNDVVSDGTRLTSRDASGEPFADRAADAAAGSGKLLYADQHGDVTARYSGVDTFGTRTFDPFGTPSVSAAAAGETPSVGFQGEWTEPTTGAVNMQARWYTPSTGSFASRDTLTIPQLPSTAGNRHAYGMANPLGTVDPSGHVPCWVLTVKPKCDDTPPKPQFDYPQSGYAHGGINGPSGWGGFGTNGEGGSGYGPGTGGTGFFPPPPPPLWQTNLDNPPKRPPPGSTVPPRPPTKPSWEPGHSDLIDRSDWLADNATEITEDSVDPSEIGVQPIDFEPGDGSGGTCEGGFGHCAKPPLNNDRNFWEDLWDDFVEGTGRSADLLGDLGAWVWKYRGPLLSTAGAIAGIICLFPGPHSIACAIAGATFALSTLDGLIGCIFGGSVETCVLTGLSIGLLGFGKGVGAFGSFLFREAGTLPFGTRWLGGLFGGAMRVAEGGVGTVDPMLNWFLPLIGGDTIKEWHGSGKTPLIPKMCDSKTC